MSKKRELEFDYKISSYLAFKHAQDFRKSAALLNDNKITKPIMVNIAFSCELYMKALLMWSNKKQEVISAHKLDELFEMFDPELQKKIKNDSGIKCWDRFLKESSDAFCSWRYYYEKDNVMFGHIGYLFSFAEALDEICLKTILVEEILKNGKIG